jgi:hypothetical protein
MSATMTTGRVQLSCLGFEISKKKAPLSLLVTSRFIPAITEEFRDDLLLEVRASDEDVRKYVGGHILQLSNCVRKSNQLQELITSGIISAVDGMYAVSLSLLPRSRFDSATLGFFSLNFISIRWRAKQPSKPLKPH